MRYENPEAGKQWWLVIFGCKQVPLPDWDNPRPFDIALQIADKDYPTILLTDSLAPEPDRRPMLFSGNIKKAHRYLKEKGCVVGPIVSDAGPEHFDVQDVEGNVIEVCA